MDRRTSGQLRALNRLFYREQAGLFDVSRMHAWPGWERIPLPARSDPPGAPRVLDVGCGNGRFAHALRDRLEGGFAYTGVDESEPLLARARERLVALGNVTPELLQIDVLEGDPDAVLPRGPFDLVVAFGLLHHVPGRNLRRALIESLARRVACAGHLVFTAWQFADHERFANRIVPWSAYAAGNPKPIELAGLEAGDHLLSFGDPKAAVRYCHHCDEAELDELVAGLSLSPLARFSADGQSGDLNRYVVMQRTPDTSHGPA